MAVCRRHNAYNCRDAYCRQQERQSNPYPGYSNGNLGDLSYDASSGGLAVGIGGGLAIDTANGDLAIDLGGISFDL